MNGQVELDNHDWHCQASETNVCVFVVGGVSFEITLENIEEFRSRKQHSVGPDLGHVCRIWTDTILLSGHPFIFPFSPKKTSGNT